MLRISTKSRYAVRIMVYLALQNGSHPSRKQDIAEAEEISPDYVEQILIRLRGGGLVMSHRGARGGFTLARDAHQITVLEVLEAAEGPLELVPGEEVPSRLESICITRKLWGEAGDLLRGLFGGVTVADVADEVTQLQRGEQIMYDI